MAGMGAICGLATHLRAICFLRPAPSHPQPREGTACGVKLMSVQQRMPRNSHTPKKPRVHGLILLVLCHAGSELRQGSPNFLSRDESRVRHLLLEVGGGGTSAQMEDIPSIGKKVPHFWDASAPTTSLPPGVGLCGMPCAQQSNRACLSEDEDGNRCSGLGR